MINEVWLPNALHAGVDYELFWRLNPKRLKPFIKVYEQKQKQIMERINFTAWLHGVYMTHAYAAVSTPNNRYLSEPIALYETEEDKEKKAKNEADLFGAYAIKFNQEYEKKQGNDDSV